MSGITEDEQVRVLQDALTETRLLPAPPNQVMAAFADVNRRRRWFRLPGETSRALDFRVGGGETITAQTAVSGSAELIQYTSHILDVVEDERVVFAYRSQVNERTHSVALVTVTLAAAGDESTALTYSDQHTLFVHRGEDAPVALAHHQGGIRHMLNGLRGALRLPKAVP